MAITDDWLGSVVGQALDPDGHYGNQCVDAVDHYAEFIYGVRWQDCVGGVSGARQLLDAAPDAYWTRIDYYHGFIPQRGDVLVYGGDRYNQWGHTAVVESADGIGINVVQQDGFGAPLKFIDDAWYSDKPAARARLAYSQNGTGALAGVLRPRPEKFRAALTPQSETITPLSEDDELNKDQDGALGTVFSRTNQAPAAGLIASQGDINIVLSRLGRLEDALLSALGKPVTEPSAVLVKGDQEATVYAWDGGTGYRALDYAEFAALMASGAELRTVEQATISGGVK